MITNASDKTLDFSIVPNVEDALSGWLRKIHVATITKSVVNFRAVEERTVYEIFAVRQPFTTKQLAIKPEGQRAWQWETLHVRGSDVEFCLDDQVLIDGKKYRIMQKMEWQDRGFIEYQLVEDWGQVDSVSISESSKITEVQDITNGT